MKRSGRIIRQSEGAAQNPGSMTIEEAVKAIRRSCLFDESFYVDSYASIDPIVRFVDPISHYLEIGYARGYKPSAAFDGSHLAREGSASGWEAINPLLATAISTKPSTEWRPSGRTSAGSGGPGNGSRWSKSQSRAPDFSKLLAKRKRPETPVLDVIMPVFGGCLETLHSIHSVLRSRNRTEHEFIVIDDRSPHRGLVQEIERLSRRGLFTLIRNKSNLGFVKTVNRALCLHEERDVILLNSDTCVSGDWIDRLSLHATSQVATITPFSNMAELCSYPRIFDENTLPDGASPLLIDRLAKTVNRATAVDIPTGVGFCMYVTREALRKIGLFDARTFRQGYGEENDFCFRAADAGMRNVHALDVFVYHKGHVSFGPRATQLKRAHSARLFSKHPDGARRLRTFAAHDPGRAARRNLDVALLFRRAGGVLCFDSRIDQANVTRRQPATHAAAAVTALATPELGGQRFRIGVHRKDASTINLRNLSYGGDNSDLKEILMLGFIGGVKVRNLSGFAQGALKEIARACRLAKVPLERTRTPRTKKQTEARAT